MTNTKSRKGSAKSTLTNETVVASMDELDGAGRNWFRHGNNDMLSENTDVDDEEYINDSDTGTSFSLEECMNEFRARRNRRISLHSRQEADRGRDEHKSHDVTETDLINQNLCNKEQERKCKPCKNGFCYCFTSDSGDGAGSVGGLTACGYTRASNIRQSRRHRRSDFFQADEKANDYRTVAAEERSSKSLPNTPRTQRNGKTNSEAFGKNQLTAISRLENSHDDAPLIHIIQELRDNCVISEVRVNKEKLKANHLSHYQQAKSGTEKKVQINHQKIDSTTKPHNVQQSSAKIIPVQRQEPTAPSWESIAETGTPQSDCLLSSPLENCSSKHIGQAKCRNVAGGRLLQKRLSSFNFSYKPAYKKEPPPKPPRSSHSFEENLSTSTNTTSLSVREAERVLDEYLAEKGYTIPTISKRKSQGTKSKPWSNTESPSETYIKKDILITRKGSGDTKTTYPSLKDIERVIDSKKPSQYERNIRKLSEGEPKVYRIGWNEPRINYMLNYDSKRSRKEFQTSSTKAQPQQSAGAYVLPEEGVGWKIPPNVDLDMVDGEVHHNLATNVENKDTPVKSKTIGPKSSATSKKQRVIWSEQLRNLSPWSNKQKLPCEIKSSLRSSSKSFLKSSKIKILRLVSPKKENKERFNFQIRKTPHRHVAIQTSRENLSHHQYSQSPPGSYHSPVQSTNLQSSHFAQSHITTVTGDKPDEQHFDFARHIHSPSKKAIRPSQRKLYFPLNCAESCSSPPLTEIETYRSFNEELDQHLSLSKMSYILTNIRAKLEANDDLAVQTFQETDRREYIQTSNGVDNVDGRQDTRQEPLIDIHNNVWSENQERAERRNDPIYSEIDEDSIHISESPNFDNHMGIQHFTVDHNSDVVYARVNKSKKRINNSAHLPPKATALGRILHDSIKHKRTMSKTTFLPPLPEPLGGETVSYSSARSLCGQQPQCQSLNNVRVMEHDSQPKRQRNLSKSDLSLHRSEIFLENLCKSELLVTNLGCYGNGRLQKIENDKPNQSHRSIIHTMGNANDNASVSEQFHDVAESYDVPIEYVYNANESIPLHSTPSGNNIGLSAIDPPLRDNQSTPKKPLFSTKDECEDVQLYVDSVPAGFSRSLNTSCPNPSIKHYECDSRNEILNCQSLSASSHCLRTTKELKPINNLPGLKHMTLALRKSFRKGKKFIKSESKKLSTSLNLIGLNRDGVNLKNKTISRSELIFGSSFDLDSLFSNKSASVDEQLTKVVHICRKLPDLENSAEMVEAERLLLFSKLRRDKQENTNTTPYHTMDQRPMLRFFIDDMFLPVRADVNHDIFFNYFYIVTFECGGIIRSTHSAECQNSVAVFRDCGIEFSTHSENEIINKDQDIVRCNIFMLRLRKVSTLSLEPTKKKIPESAKRNSVSSTSSSLSDEVVSRFRLNASFTLDSSSFIPYEYVEQESRNSNHMCLRASRVCNIPLTSRTKSSHLSLEMKLKGRAEVCFQKRLHSGFLNVEDPFTQHNWNRRWCTLDGCFLKIWDDVNNLNEAPLLSLDMRDFQQHKLYAATRDLCARPRSFRLEGVIRRTNEKVFAGAIYFSAENQKDLSAWLENLNFTLDFILRWLVPP